MRKTFGFILCLLAGQGFAAPHLTFGASGDWEIRVNSDNGQGCYMQKQFEDGTLVQLGTVPDREGAFFAAYNTKWSTIVEGDTGSLLFDFGDERFQGEVVGDTFEGVPGGFAFFNNPEFVSEFGRRISVIVTGDSGTAQEIDLSGSSNAIASVRECQSKQ